MPTWCSHYFYETVRGAERQGLDGDRLLANVGLTRDQIADPLWRGDVRLMARLMQLIWRALNDEFMGLIRRPAKPGTFALMAHFVLGEPSLEAALRKGVLFYGLVVEGIEMKLDVKFDQIFLSIRFLDEDRDSSHYFLEFWLLVWSRFIGWLGRKVPILKCATFAYAQRRRHKEELARMFHCPCVFDAGSTSLVFDRSFLQSPIIRDRNELKHFLSSAPIGFMTPPEEATNFARRVRAILMTRTTNEVEFPSFADVAQQLSMTEQTLRRRLKTEGTSFRILKETIRRDLATEKLLENRMTVGEIGYLLGFSEPRAFTRAFHQWTGRSPVNFRRMLQDQVRSSRQSGSRGLTATVK